MTTVIHNLHRFADYDIQILLARTKDERSSGD